MRFSLTILLLLLSITAFGERTRRDRNPHGGITTVPISSGSSLNTGLTAYWKMDEGSGATRVDSGSNAQDLTDHNTVGSVAGKIMNAGDFEFDTATYLSHADDATLSLGTDTDFTFVSWVKLESKPAFGGGIICKDGTGDNTHDEYLLYWDSGTDRFVILVGNGTTSATVPANTFGAPSLATFYFIAWGHDTTANTLWISVNDGTKDTVSWTGGTQDTTAQFQIGARVVNTGFAFDGLIDEVGFWKRKLTDAEVTEAYNSSNGKTCCPF